jgi:hypothetical protein
VQVKIKDSKEKKYEIEIIFQDGEEKEDVEKNQTFEVLRKNKKVVETTKGFYTSSEDFVEVIAILIGALDAEEAFEEIESRGKEVFRKNWATYELKQEE